MEKDTVYEYTMHRNLWDLIRDRKFNWFRIQPDRKDREKFIASIKSFIDNWGCAEFFDDTYSKFRVFERITPEAHQHAERDRLSSIRFPDSHVPDFDKVNKLLIRQTRASKTSKPSRR